MSHDPHMAARRRVGFYERRIFPWLNDRFTSEGELPRLRAEALASASGRVLEIGFGTGANLPHYPGGVRAVVGLEPNDGMLDRAAARLKDSRLPVQLVIGKAESLPFRDATFDTVVSTLTLCSVFDLPRALDELRRVQRDDGRLIVLEHGLAAEARVARWQNKLNRLQNVLACGCNLNRPIAAVVQQHGFVFDTIRTFYLPRAPRTHGWFTLGVAGKRPPGRR